MNQDSRDIIRKAKLEACTQDFITKVQEIGYSGAKNWLRRQGHSGDFVADVLQDSLTKLQGSEILLGKNKSSPPSSRRSKSQQQDKQE